MTIPSGSKHRQLIEGRLLIRNTIWNLIGQGLPLVAAVFAIPLLISGLGTDRFGILTLAWMLVGYFSLFDLGLGRALTKLVSENLGANDEEKIPPLVWTSLLLMFVLGILGCLLAIAITPILINLLKIPDILAVETYQAFLLLAFSIPIVITTAGLRGILESYQAFGPLNIIRIPMGLLNFLGPLAILPMSQSLVPIVGILLFGRAIGCIAHLWLCFKHVPTLRDNFKIDRSKIKPLFKFGGWMTVSNVISPVMVNLDRFLIGSLTSMTHVAYYTTPYEVVSKLSILPTGLMRVLFPAFTTTASADRNEVSNLFYRSYAWLSICLLPVIMLFVAFSDYILFAWLGEPFATNSSRVLQWLAIGLFINSLALIPFSLVQGLGRPDITAFIHMAELPLYLTSIVLLTLKYGIEGAALAWTGRMAIDLVLLLALSSRLLPSIRLRIKQIVNLTILTTASLMAAMIPTSMHIRVTTTLLMIIGTSAIYWHLFLEKSDKLSIKKLAFSILTPIRKTHTKPNNPHE